jgi:hypothetical protein
MSSLTDPLTGRNLSTRRQRRHELRPIGSDVSWRQYYAMPASQADAALGLRWGLRSFDFLTRVPDSASEADDGKSSSFKDRFEVLLSVPDNERLCAFYFAYDVSAMLRGITPRDERSPSRLKRPASPNRKSPIDQAE